MIQKIFQLRIATYNIRNTQDRYLERVDFLKKTIHDVQADFMGLQEVAFGEGGQLDYLVEQKFDCYLAPTQIKIHNYGTDPEARLDGNVILERFGQELTQNFFSEWVKEHQIYNINQIRTAQKLEMLDPESGIRILIINAHLHHVIEDSHIRVEQIEGIFKWIEKDLLNIDLDIIFMGDLNCLPTSREYDIIQARGFKSSFKVINGQEPDGTFPTGIIAPRMDTDLAGTFDYIWYRGKNLTPTSSCIFGEKQLMGAEDIYPSDHMGIVTNFSFN